jgi:hypothetical protein
MPSTTDPHPAAAGRAFVQSPAPTMAELSRFDEDAMKIQAL